jgi:mono/diheme cytochrome c family protein
MKRKILLVVTVIIASAGITFAADAAANWNQHCASCHGKDGSGNTMMGKKLSVKSYQDAKVQSEFTDAKATEVIKDGVKEGGKEKMKSYKEKLSDDEIKALVAYVRSLKK